MPRDATHRSPNTDYASRVPIRCPNSRGFPVNAGMPFGPLADEKPPLCRHIPKESALHVLLAMQKVEGSNPFSRFAKGPHLQAFLLLVSRIVRLLQETMNRQSLPVVDVGTGQKLRPCRRFLATST